MGHWILPSLLSQCYRAAPERIRRRRVESGARRPLLETWCVSPLGRFGGLGSHAGCMRIGCDDRGGAREGRAPVRRPKHSGGLSAAILVSPYPPTVRVRQGRGGRDEVQSQDDPDLLGQGDPDLGDVDALHPTDLTIIQDAASSSISVTSGHRDGVVRSAWRGDFRGIGVRLCRIVDINFAECHF